VRRHSELSEKRYPERPSEYHSAMAISIEATRVTSAVEQAMLRLEPIYRAVIDTFAGTGGVTETVHAPLGEVVMWLASLDEIVGNHRKANGAAGYLAQRNADPQGRAVFGLKVVRNSIAHGGLPVEFVGASGGTVLGWWVLGTAALGSGPSCTWLPSSVLSANAQRHAARPAYDSDVAGRDLLDPLQRALSFLRNEAGT